MMSRTRPNLLVKILAMEESLAAITGVIAEGISVNVTLIFSFERHPSDLASRFSWAGAGRG